MTLEKLAKAIYDECEKDGEPVTMEEATEMARMEINSKEFCKRYEKAEKPRKASTKERKVDETKKRILLDCKVLMEGLGAKITNMKTETEISFSFNGEEYSLKLVKHRKKKS